MTNATDSSETANRSEDEVVRVCGDILDWKIEAIIESGATLSELEVARAWASGQDEVLGEERDPLAGRTAEVYDILVADEELDDET